MFQSACLCIQIIPGNPQVLDFHFLCCCRCVAPVGECGIDAFLVDVYPFQLFVDKGNGGFLFSLFFLRQTVVARSLRQAVNKGEGGVLPFRVPSFPEDVGSDAVHGGTYVLLFVGGERLVIDDVVFQLIQHSVGRVEGLACSVHMFLAFVLLPLQSYDLCAELLNFSELFVQFVCFQLVLFQ